MNDVPRLTALREKAHALLEKAVSNGLVKALVAKGDFAEPRSHVAVVLDANDSIVASTFGAGIEKRVLSDGMIATSVPVQALVPILEKLNSPRSASQIQKDAPAGTVWTVSLIDGHSTLAAVPVG